MTHEELEILAAEYVTGLADAADRDRADALLHSDTDFARRVAFWRDRMGEIDATADAVAPNPMLWDRIAASVAAVPARQVATPEERVSWWDRLWNALGFWRAGALVATAAAVLLAIGLGREIATRAPAIELVAVLETDENRPAAVVNVYADGTAVLVPLRTFEVPSDRVIQVWTLQTREQGPVSVGLMSQAQTLRLDLGRLPRPTAGHLFEMTLEPAGGSPRPTGRILTKGFATRSL